MNKTEPRDFYINAAISSKSEKSPGVLFLAPCAEIVLFGNMSVHTSNTCESKKIISGTDSSRSMYKEYESFFLDIKEKINSSKNQGDKTVANKMTWFVDTIEKFIIKLEDFLVENENIRSDLTGVIYPSRSGGMLEDLKENLIGKMKPWALPSSGKDDKDHVDLITDDKGMNVAKLNGAEKLYYHNGSDLVSWMPTGTQLKILTQKLNLLLGYTSNDLIAHSEYFFSYVLQTFMNVIFVNNPHLLEIERKRIVRNYKILLENISNENTNQFKSYEHAKNNDQKAKELERPTKFIKFLLNQICKETSLQNLGLNKEENGKKYIDSITAIASLLGNAKHPNQVLVEQWMENVLAMGDAFCGKNNVLYLPLYKILQRFISLDLFKFENDKDKIEFKQMLHFMVNLSGKFRFKKTQFNLNGTEVQAEYKFGAQITTEGKYKVSKEYNTAISFDYFQQLTQKIVEFEKFEEEIRKTDYKFSDENINKIIKYLLDGRYFYDDVIEKILKDQEFSKNLIEKAKESKIDDEECCYKSAYEILVNDYFDLLDKYDCVDKSLLTHTNLIKYFHNNKRKGEIIDLEPNLIFELGLFENLDAKTINSFLGTQEKKPKMLAILKLVIGRLKQEKLNELDFSNFDNDLLEAVVLSRISDIDNKKMKEIDFQKLKLDAQKFLFKKMADNDFRDFDFDIHWSRVNVEVFKSASIGEWRKFVFNKIPYHNNENNKKIIDTFCKRSDILQSMPVNILSLFDTMEQDDHYTFFNFFDDCFDCWSTEQVLTFGRCRNERRKPSLEEELQDYERGHKKVGNAKETEQAKEEIKNQLDKLIKNDLKELENKIKKDKIKKDKIQLKENALSTFISLQSFFQKLDDKLVRNNQKGYTWIPKEILLEFFKTHLLDNKHNEDNINQCLKYVFSNCQSNYFLAMIIMEEFILLNGEVRDKDEDAIALSEISKKIKFALGWNNEDKRKAIIKNLFQFIPKINELMHECDRIVAEKQDSEHSFRFMTLLNIYKSFLNKILLLYPDCIDKDDVKKISVYFLDDGERIKQFFKMYGDIVHIACLSEIIDSANGGGNIQDQDIKDIAKNPEQMYKFKKVKSVLKILDVIDVMEKIKEDSRGLDPENLIYDFIIDVKITAKLICFGYPIDEPGNSIETHLSQYNEDGKFDYNYFDSVLYGMFKNLCNKKITIDKFIEQYDYKLDESQKKQLGEIIKSKNNTDNFSSFEKFILPLIENDYKNMNFAPFVQRYDLLKNTIGVENVDKRMINIAYDFVEEKLSFEEFINKYYVLPRNEINKNEIINPEIDDYHIEALKNDESQNILTRVLINNEDTKTVINLASDKTIENLYKNLLPKSKNMTNKQELKQMRDSVVKYLNAVKQCKVSGMLRGDTSKLANILFAKEESDAETKASKFKTMIDVYLKNNKVNWENFSEIYILQHISQKNMKKYIELIPDYNKILDLNAKTENLENIVKEFYTKIHGIKGCIEVLNKCYDSINSVLYHPFLFDMQENVMDPGFINNFKTLFQGLVAINKIYANDEAVKICKKYEHLIQDNNESSIKKFFSSMVNFVHFIKDYRKLAKILLIDMYEKSAGSEEKKISDLANNMFNDKSGRNFNPNENFTFTFVYCLDELEKTLKLTYQEYQSKKNKKTKEISEAEYVEKQQALQKIYDKYKKYGDRFFTSRDVEIMCQKSDKDEDSDFQKDFELVRNTLEEIGFLKKDKVFKSCVDEFKHGILANYEKGFESDTTLEKFLDLGYQKYFSDGQIDNLGVINRFNSEINDICTPKAVIKKLPKIASDESREKLDQTSEDLSLRPGDKLDYIIASGNSGAICTDTMRKLFWHMDYRKLKTFVGDYSFKDFKGENKKIASFGAFLQNALIGAFGYKSFGFKSNKTTQEEKDKDIKEQIENANKKNTLIEYNKMSVSQKFIFGECFFGGMFRSICQINKLKEDKKKYGNNSFYNKKIYNIDVEKELDELINKIKSRVLSICQNQSVIPPMNKNKLALIQAMPNKKSFNASLEELIARAFLSAHIYAYSGHIDGNEHDKSLLDFENNVFDKIISMLSRSEEHDKFQNIGDIKKWVDESSLKYFIQGTFNFKEIPENELSSHQMELEQNDLIAKYNIRILNHILSKTGDQVSAFEVFEKIYLDDKNKVIYKFDFMKLLDLLSEKVITTAKKEEDFLTLLKFLKKVKIPEKKKEMSEADCDKFFNCLLECAKNANLLDKNKKFVNKKALTWWIENVVLVFAVDVRMNDDFREKIFMCMADNIGKNISVMDVIDILKTTAEKDPDGELVSALSGWCEERFVNNLFGQKETQFISAENSKNLDKDKLKNVFCFLDEIGPFSWFDLLNLFPLLDVMNEKEKLISIDIPNGTKKFINEDSLQNFFGYEIIDAAGNEYKRMVIELLKFLYAISRIPKDKTLLDVVKKFKEFEKDDEKKIFINQEEYSPKVFESAVQAMYNCLTKEKDNINKQNKSDYINFLIRFFTNIKPQEEIGQNVSKMIGDIFNLFQSQELLKHMDNIRDAFSENKSKTPILYSIFCKSIENMGNDDITNGNLLKVLEMLESLENISEFDFNKLKNVLNEKIKTVMSNNEEPKKMANDILSIVSVKKISSLLDLSPCLDALNSENLVLSEDHPTQKVFKNLEPLTDFIQNGVSKDNKDFDNKWIRFKYAMQRIPKNMTVVNVLQKIKLKENDIWNFNFPELPGNLYANDFCKDICSRIQEELNSMPQDNQKLFETVDVLIEFFKKITLLDKKNSKINDCFKKNWEDIVKDKNTNNESFIAFSIIDTLKILLSKYKFYKFNDVNDVNTFFEQIKKILKELKLDSKEDAGTNIFVPTVLSALNNSDLNIFLLLEYLCHQYCKEMGDKSRVCHCALQNKDILNKLSDMFKQQIEKLEKEEIANVKFPDDFDHNYEKSGIKFLVQQFVVNGDMNSFQSVVHSALRICYCNITEDKLNIKKCKIVGNGEKYNWAEQQKEQIVKVDSWLHKFFHIFYDNRSELTDYQLGILQKMALEYLIDTLGKDIKIFDVLNKLIDETKNLGKYNISANDKVDEATTLSKDMSKILVNKILDEKFSEEKKIEEDEEEEEIKIFEADKKIRCASIFVKLMRFKVDDNEEKRLFNVLRVQQKAQKLEYLEYEEAEKKKEEEKRRKEEEEKKKKEEEEKQNDKKHNENNNPEDKKNTKVNAELKKDIGESITGKDNKQKKEQKEEEKRDNQSKENTANNKQNNQQNNEKNSDGNSLENKRDTEINTEPKKVINENNKQKEKNEINIIDSKSNNTIEQNMNNNVENTINQNSITEKAKQIENPINKKNILIKALAWLLTSCLVLLCIYFFIQAAIAKALITLILTIIFVVASILLTIYLPNKKEQNIDTIKTPLSEENGMYNSLNEQYDQPQKQIIEEERKKERNNN